MRKQQHWWFALLIWLLPLWAGAASLSASVDRTELGMDDTLRLTVKADTEIEINLGSIFNLQNLELPAPDLGDLKDSFEVLDTNQSYSIRSVNGQHNAEITWTYLLAPKKTGELQIPKLTFKDAESQPLSVTVTKQSPAATGKKTDSNAFIEASFDKSEVYVQEQVTLTVRLFYRPPLIGGDLEQPEPDDAIIEPLEKQKEYTKTRDGRSWRVVERTYVIYPQKSGKLELAPLEFQGRRRDSYGNLQFLRTRSDPLTVTVNPPPDSFTGDTWLPASSLVLDENWSKDPEDLKTGDSVTRTLTLRALGLLGSALPPIDDRYPDAVKHYPEQPKLDSSRQSGSVQSTRKEATAVVPVQGGTITLPAVRIPWWDTVNDVQRVAEIPQRTLKVKGGAVSVAPPTPAASRESGQEPPSPASGSNQPEADRDGQAAGETSNTGFWIALAILFGLGWLVTALLWYRQRQRPAPPEERSAPVPHGTTFDEVCKLARQKDPAFLEAFPAWARQKFHRSDLQTTQDVVSLLDDAVLARQIEALQAALYSPNGRKDLWNPDRLIERLKQIDETARGMAGKDQALPPLYPGSGIRSGA
ncbi:BatD family protein [Marinobacteraceae bacterium S3BR75-40.1]